MKNFVLYIAIMIMGVASLASEPTHVITLMPNAPIGPISSYIYGSNHEVEGFVFYDARRLGGNRLTAYNWELDASNAGRDYRHQNDHWLTRQAWWEPISKTAKIQEDAASPAGAIHNFHNESLARDSYSLITVPMAGYVAGDADGPVSTDDVAPSSRWQKTQPTAGDGAKESGVVYADEMVKHLVDAFGPAGSERGIEGYSLDNEPALWMKTHALSHPEQATCEEVMDKSIAIAAAIKSVDPKAETYGPALWGVTAYDSLSQAPDWKQIKTADGYRCFIDYYLDQMRAASESQGVRLLDVLDVHWYTEDPLDREVEGADASQAARALYDEDYADPSWVGKHFGRHLPLIPKLKQSIDKYFPGTRIGITEYDWPMTGTIYGGIAQADALGAFGKHGVYFAAYHHKVGKKPDRYVGSAFQLYRNFDQKGGKFADTAIPVDIKAAGDHSLIAYASTDESNALHLIVINPSESMAANTQLKVAGVSGIKEAQAWFFDAANPAVRPANQNPQVANGSVGIEVPPLSVWHVVLDAGH